jgi:voltage-gated potassium channel Kch
LGAFFAGMVVNGSDLSHEAATEALPLQDAFSVLFFVAVGMLFDPAILLRQPLEILAVALIVVIGKSLAAFFIVLAFRYPVATALTISASLAQIGEFSFIAAPDPYKARAIMELARSANPEIETIARTHSESQRSYLERHGVGLALIGEHELALGLGRATLVRMGHSPAAAEAARSKSPAPRQGGGEPEGILEGR